MQEGFFAIFDALGFKGIWDRAARASPPWDVLGKLKKLTSDAEDVRGGVGDACAIVEQVGSIKGTSVKTLLLSDTIVAAASAEDATGNDAENGSWAALLSVSCVVSGILAHAATAPEPKLAYRGCISYGAFEIRSNFVIGPAVDEAATLMNSAEAALVWFTPTAKRKVDSFSNFPIKYPMTDLVRQWRVPMKNGHHYESYVISPYVGLSEKSWVPLCEAIMATFSSNQIDVQLKAQHTGDFLKHELGRLQNERSGTAT